MARVTIAQTAGVAAIVAAIGTCRFVGGCVRDALAGQVAKDIDLATPHTPDHVIERLKAADIKAVPTGLAHGTVTAVMGGDVVEVTTLRRDVATDGRRATIAYTADWQEDAARRDFTINALYADPATGEVTDYFGGVDDLSAGLVRFIGNPLDRIAEDHLRILRFFRFHARFGKGAPDAAALSACTARANDLMALSRERIATELLALLALPDPAPTVALMFDAGIFKPVLPEIDAAPLARLTALEREHNIAPHALRRLSALLPANPARVDEIAKHLKLSNAQRKRLTVAAARTPDDAANPFATGYTHGVELATDRILLVGGDARALNGWTPPQFPLSGGDIIALGLTAGPDVARALRSVELQWVAEDFPDKTRCLAIARGVI